MKFNEKQRKEQYKKHLASDYWKSFLKQYRPKYCQWSYGCLVKGPLDGHHTTYEHFGQEKKYPKDIKFYCRPHHDKIHFTWSGKRRKDWRSYSDRIVAASSNDSIFFLFVLLFFLALWLLLHR